MKKFRFHVVGLPHTQVTKNYLSCAYTQKVLNFCKMMKSLGHEVFLYASEETDVQVDELIPVISKSQQQEFFGGVDTTKSFYPIEWDEKLPYWKIMNENAITEIKKRIQPHDFIALIGGSCHAPIAQALNQYISVEFGIGYKGIFSPYKVFESYAWMHHCYGLNQIENGQYFDTVIPNYFDPADFPLAEKKEDYYVYIGRMIQRKGAHIAVEVCGKLGKKLVLAGQGVTHNEPGLIKTDGMELRGEHITHIGTVDVKQRGELLSKATAVFVPTQYIEPFGGVHIEAMLCGTPVITTDWGVFTETVTNGFNGYRTRSFQEMAEAVEKVKTLDPVKIREWAIANYGLERVAQLYQAYFEQLSTLWEKGWYSEEKLTDYNRYSKIWPTK